MLNLFKSKKESGKPPPSKSSRRGQTSTNRAGARTASGEARSSWFGGKSSRPAKNNNNNIKVVEIRSISSSAPALNQKNNNNEGKKSDQRPLTIVGDDSNVTLRRGQQSSKIDSQTPDDLSRSSSATNLNVDQKAAKGAKPKKSDSKDKLDKVAAAAAAADKKHDKNGRALNKNNNKESGDVEPLQKQLAQMEKEKSSLALQLGEQTGHLNKLQGDIAQLKMLQEESNQKLEQLMDENTILRNRLRDVAHSPLSDNEKQQLLYESHREHSSAPASIATNLLDDGGDVTPCHTPEWDKHSSSNTSAVSVACLQDKINQMQETHYSTNEELQATLQELTDLQRQLTELQQENVRLNEEKNLMFESLCRQTERLNDSRNEVESLKQLLCKDENGQFESAAEREQKLVDLLKSAQEERENLLMKQEQLGNELEDSRSTNLIHDNEISQLSERVKTLESTLDAKHAEHKLLDQELAQAKDQSSSRQIEINRLKDLLENARTKINELEQDRALSDKSELDELLDNARKEKDALESEVAHLKEQLALSKNETEKLKEQVSILQEECKVIRNNAKTTQSDLEYKLEKLLSEKSALADQLQQFQEAVNELQIQAQGQLDDKRQLSAVLSETQRNLNESERRIADLENELVELKRTKQEQEEEWEKFQNDLLTSVRVANDFKTEAQQDLQKLIMENKAGRERIKQLEAQIDKLKGGSRRKASSSPHLSNEETLMATLNRRYKEIEALPENQLTEEEKAVKVLKIHYDRELPRQKPVAHKPKDKLAISKPSLESVISNPKLEKIVSDAQVRNVEAATYVADRVSLMDDLGPPVDEMDRKNSFPKVHSDVGLQIPKELADDLTRSRSLSDLPKATEDTNLRRYESTEDLLSLTKNKKLRKKSTVNLGILEQICNQIDPNLPEDQLTNEQRFALRLKEVLDREGRKATLKKNSKLGRKKVVITRPTKESVESNTKLRRIIQDPLIRNVQDSTKIVKREKPKHFKKAKQRYSMPVSSEMSERVLSGTKKKSTSYNDISFKFQAPNMYSEQEAVPVLPPESFRDLPPISLEDHSIFTTFKSGNNTFKKEHNYLEEDPQDPNFETTGHHLQEEEKDVTDGYYRHDFSEDDPRDLDFETTGHHLQEEEKDDTDDYYLHNYSEDDPRDLDFDSTEEEDRRHHLQEEERGDPDGYYQDDFEFTEEDTIDGHHTPEDQKTTEILNEIVTRRLEYEDSLRYDEEELAERRNTRQRYSHVVKEIKDSFDKSSDEEEQTDGHHQGIPVIIIDSSEEEETSRDEEQTEDDWRLTEEEVKLVEEYSKRRPSRPLSEIKPEDLAMVDGLREHYLNEDGNFLDADQDADPRRSYSKTDDSHRKEEDERDKKEDNRYGSHAIDALQLEDNEANEDPANLKKRAQEHPFVGTEIEDTKLREYMDYLEKQYPRSNKNEHITSKEIDDLDGLESVQVEQQSEDYEKEKIASERNDVIDLLEPAKIEDDELGADRNEDLSSLGERRINYSSYGSDKKENVASKQNDVIDLLEPAKIDDNELGADKSEDVDGVPERRRNDGEKEDGPCGSDRKENIAFKRDDVIDLLEPVRIEDNEPGPDRNEELGSVHERKINSGDREDSSNIAPKQNKVINLPEPVKTEDKKSSPDKNEDLDSIPDRRRNYSEKEDNPRGSDKKQNILSKQNDVIDLLEPVKIEGGELGADKKEDPDSAPERRTNYSEKGDNPHGSDIKQNIVSKQNDVTDLLEPVKIEPNEPGAGKNQDLDGVSERRRNYAEKEVIAPKRNDVIDLLEPRVKMEDNKPNEDLDTTEAPETKDLDSLQKRHIHEQPVGHGQNEDGFHKQVPKLDPEPSEEEEGKPREEEHVFPRILSPTKLHLPSSYEPVYENFYISTNKHGLPTTPPIVSGRKPIALPRISSLDTSEQIYKDFGGQIRKTRFSITYDRQKGDTFKERNQEKSAKVRDLREMFERKSKSDFSSLVSKALEDD